MGRPGPKKKARMSRTRSDFLTRCNSEGATQSDDDDEYYVPAHSHTLPPSLSPLCAHPEADCHSDSEMVKILRLLRCRDLRAPHFLSTQPASPSPLYFSGGLGRSGKGRGLLTILTPLSPFCRSPLNNCWSARLLSRSHCNRLSRRHSWARVNGLARRTGGCRFQTRS